MEQNFQTSFIPKKPIVEERLRAPSPVGSLMIFSVIIFFLMVASYGGFYFYKGFSEKNVKDMEASLVLAKKGFESEQIDRLQTLDKRLSAAGEVLNKHTVVSPIFQTLESITKKSIRYTKFSYGSVAEKSNLVSVKMSGQALNYQSIALQADLFSKNKNLIDPVFSNLSLDEKTSYVTFDLDFSVNPDFINYKKVLATKK